MNAALWSAAGLLALIFLASGLVKLTQPMEKLAGWGFAFVEDFSTGTIRTIALLEILAAAGLVLPVALGIAPVLAPLAAVGLVLLMAGAIAVHARRREAQGVVVALALLILALLVALGHAIS